MFSGLEVLRDVEMKVRPFCMSDQVIFTYCTVPCDWERLNGWRQLEQYTHTD